MFGVGVLVLPLLGCPRLVLTNPGGLALLTAAGVNFVMGVPGADDVMLGYQSTSFHDALAMRDLYGKRPAPEFEAWLARHFSGLYDGVRYTGGSKVDACRDLRVDLIVDDPCSQAGCKSNRAIMFTLEGKVNKIYVCAKLGCPGHRMEIVNLLPRVLEQVSDINYFGAQADDIFMEI